jgi:hypothetical protein
LFDLRDLGLSILLQLGALSCVAFALGPQKLFQTLKLCLVSFLALDHGGLTLHVGLV